MAFLPQAELITFDMKTEFFINEKKKNENPYGMDCITLIKLLAECATMHFEYKTTATLKKCCTPAVKISSGDILWIKGHVLILYYDEKNNTYHGIQMSGYSNNGKGCLWMAPFENLFPDIKILMIFKKNVTKK